MSVLKMDVKNIILVVILGLAAVAVSANEVIITVNNKLNYNFSAEPQFAYVAQTINPTSDWYWPGASVFTPEASTETEQTRQQLISTLQKRQRYWQTKQHQQYVHLLQSLVEYIQAMPLASHITVPLDPIGAGAKAELNRRFSQGRYLLMVPEQRPTTIDIWGAVIPQQANFIPAGAAKHYREQLDVGSEVHNSYFYIVQPNRTVLKVGTAYWNRQQLEPLPGAQLVVPFSRKVLRSDTAEVNAQLLILAKNRVL